MMRRSPTLLMGSAAPEKPRHRLLHHPIFAWLGIRAAQGQHTVAENAALKKWATERSSLVEIGVAEGGSAIVLRTAMASSGTLWLIDPFHLGRQRIINATKRAAHRTVDVCKKGRVVWIEQFSFDAAKNWDTKIDFLFLDGDHSEAGAERDWNDWHRFVLPGGVVALHDAAIFLGGWTQKDWGPVRLVNGIFRGQGLPGWRIVQEVDSLVVVQRDL